MENTEINKVKPFSDVQVKEHALKVGGERNLREVSITADDGESVFVYLVKKPNRSVLKAITDAKEKKNINGVADLMLGCVLEGDKDAYEHDGAIYEELLTQIGKLVTSAKGDVKKV